MIFGGRLKIADERFFNSMWSRPRISWWIDKIELNTASVFLGWLKPFLPSPSIFHFIMFWWFYLLPDRTMRVERGSAMRPIPGLIGAESLQESLAGFIARQKAQLTYADEIFACSRKILKPHSSFFRHLCRHWNPAFIFWTTASSTSVFREIRSCYRCIHDTQAQPRTLWFVICEIQTKSVEPRPKMTHLWPASISDLSLQVWLLNIMILATALDICMRMWTTEEIWI